MSRFDKIMSILNEYEIGNSCLTHSFFDKYSDSELDNLTQDEIKSVIGKINAYETADFPYSQEIMSAVRQNLGVSEIDMSKDDEIRKMNKNEVFDRVCIWNSLINYGDVIREWVREVYDVDLGKEG